MEQVMSIRQLDKKDYHHKNPCDINLKSANLLMSIL